MVTLNEANLDKLPDRVGRPAYDRSRLSAGIVHFGVGNFHRAHQAVYLDGCSTRARPRLGDRRRRRAPRRRCDARGLGGQDWLTTVVEQSAERSTARVTGRHDRLPAARRRRGAIVARLADPPSASSR